MGILHIAIVLLVTGASLLALVLLGLEVQYRRRLGNKVELTSGHWQLEVYEPQHYHLVGELELINQTQRLEVMIPEVRVEVTLLSAGSVAGITRTSQVIPRYKNAHPRPDGYWEGHIVKTGEINAIAVEVEIRGSDLDLLNVAWIQIHYVTYGPQGHLPKVRHVVVPLRYPDSQAGDWRSATNAAVLPIKTHLLTPLDRPVDVVQRYVSPHAQPGDVVTIGESPLAIMQGRFRHPTEIKPGWLAQRLCYLFLPTSSLATACGLQSLIDIVGGGRVLFAFIGGAIAKVFGRPGVFYQLAGEQARLIDDVTGTIPPYDQFIVLGPHDPQRVVDEIKRETGLAAAIVDANDLGAVAVLAAAGVSQEFLKQALAKNPAGNANEQTPIVLLRPNSSPAHR